MKADSTEKNLLIEEYDGENEIKREGAEVDGAAETRSDEMVKPATIMVDVITSRHETVASMGSRLQERLETEETKGHFGGQDEGLSGVPGQSRAFSSLDLSTQGAQTTKAAQRTRIGSMA